MAEIEEGQRDEEGEEHVNEETTEDVVGRAPEGPVVALRDLVQLGPEGSGIYSAISTLHASRSEKNKLTSGYIGIFCHRARQAVAFDLLNLLARLLVLGRFQPDVFPVLVSNAWRETSTNGIKHVLRVTLLVAALGSATTKTYLSGVDV